jgi:hypothetical protein
MEVVFTKSGMELHVSSTCILISFFLLFFFSSSWMCEMKETVVIPPVAGFSG